jgi:TRAP-type C4-dicarboxylate transport system permease large subunit
LLELSGSSVLGVVSEARKEHSKLKMYSEDYSNTANKIFWAVFAVVVAAGIVYAASVGNLKPSETFVVGVLCALVIGGLAYLDIHPAFHHPPEQ